MPWGVANYNTNPALNTSINGQDIAEGSAAAGYNDALRQIMADIATWVASLGLTIPIAVASGGTGSTTAGGALTNLGALAVTYKELPQSAKSAAFTFDLTQSAGHVYYTGAAANAALPANGSVAFPIGTAITIVNNGSGVLTIARDGGVSMKWAATGADANRALAAGGMAMILKVATDLWFISGAGLS